MQHIVKMGFDLFQIQDWLEQKGLWELETNTLIELMNSPTFVNVLKQGAMMPPQQQVPPGMMMAPQGQQPMGMNPMQHQQTMMMQQQQPQNINYNYQQ